MGFWLHRRRNQLLKKLKQINEELVAQNKTLMQNYTVKKKIKNPSFVRVTDTIGGGQIYTFVDGEIVNNSIIRKDNYFTINRGKKTWCFPKMGVIAPQGIAGIVINTTNNYALVQSVLSMNKIRINASLKDSGFFRNAYLERRKFSRTMHLSDIPKYVPIKVGDTVVTDGKSAIFPQGIMIGRVAGYEVDSKTGYWDISVELSQKWDNLTKFML